MIKSINSAWGYRNFIISSIFTELRIRFAGSYFGGAWMLLHPLFEVLIYALVLSSLMSARLEGVGGQFSYAIYLTAGIIAWSIFAEIVNKCLNVFIGNAHLLKKIYFPAICLPLIVSGSAVLNNLLLTGAVLVIFSLLGHFPGLSILIYPILLLTIVVFATGLGLILGIINVFIRDIAQVVPVIIQLSFWFTPVVYPIKIIPEQYHWLFNFNPMFHVVSAYQSIFVFNIMPSLVGVVGVFIFGLVLLGVSAILYLRAKSELVDML